MDRSDKFSNLQFSRDPAATTQHHLTKTLRMLTEQLKTFGESLRTSTSKPRTSAVRVKVGGQCEIFSQSNNKWMKGKITKKLDRNHIRVEYGDGMEKDIEIGDENLRLSALKTFRESSADRQRVHVPPRSPEEICRQITDLPMMEQLARNQLIRRPNRHMRQPEVNNRIVDYSIDRPAPKQHDSGGWFGWSGWSSSEKTKQTLVEAPRPRLSRPASSPKTFFQVFTERARQTPVGDPTAEPPPQKHMSPVIVAPQYPKSQYNQYANTSYSNVFVVPPRKAPSSVGGPTSNNIQGGDYPVPKSTAFPATRSSTFPAHRSSSFPIPRSPTSPIQAAATQQMQASSVGTSATQGIRNAKYEMQIRRRHRRRWIDSADEQQTAQQADHHFVPNPVSAGELQQQPQPILQTPTRSPNMRMRTRQTKRSRAGPIPIRAMYQNGQMPQSKDRSEGVHALPAGADKMLTTNENIRQNQQTVQTVSQHIQTLHQRKQAHFPAPAPSQHPLQQSISQQHFESNPPEAPAPTKTNNNTGGWFSSFFTSSSQTAQQQAPQQSVAPSQRLQIAAPTSKHVRTEHHRYHSHSADPAAAQPSTRKQMVQHFGSHRSAEIQRTMLEPTQHQPQRTMPYPGVGTPSAQGIRNTKYETQIRRRHRRRWMDSADEQQTLQRDDHQFVSSRVSAQGLPLQSTPILQTPNRVQSTSVRRTKRLRAGPIPIRAMYQNGQRPQNNDKSEGVHALPVEEQQIVNTNEDVGQNQQTVPQTVSQHIHTLHQRNSTHVADAVPAQQQPRRPMAQQHFGGNPQATPRAPQATGGWFSSSSQTVQQRAPRKSVVPSQPAVTVAPPTKYVHTEHHQHHFHSADPFAVQRSQRQQLVQHFGSTQSVAIQRNGLQQPPVQQSDSVPQIATYTRHSNDSIQSKTQSPGPTPAQQPTQPTMARVQGLPEQFQPKAILQTPTGGQHMRVRRTKRSRFVPIPLRAMYPDGQRPGTIDKSEGVHALPAEEEQIGNINENPNAQPQNPVQQVADPIGSNQRTVQTLSQHIHTLHQQNNAQSATPPPSPLPSAKPVTQQHFGSKRSVAIQRTVLQPTQQPPTQHQSPQQSVDQFAKASSGDNVPATASAPKESGGWLTSFFSSSSQTEQQQAPEQFIVPPQQPPPPRNVHKVSTYSQKYSNQSQAPGPVPPVQPQQLTQQTTAQVHYGSTSSPVVQTPAVPITNNGGWLSSFFGVSSRPDQPPALRQQDVQTTSQIQQSQRHISDTLRTDASLRGVGKFPLTPRGLAPSNTALKVPLRNKRVRHIKRSGSRPPPIPLRAMYTKGELLQRKQIQTSTQHTTNNVTEQIQGKQQMTVRRRLRRRFVAAEEETAPTPTAVPIANEQQQRNVNVLVNLELSDELDVGDLGVHGMEQYSSTEVRQQVSSDTKEVEVIYTLNDKVIGPLEYSKSTRLRDVTGYLYQKHKIPANANVDQFVEYHDHVTQGRALEGSGKELDSGVTFESLSKMAVRITFHWLDNGEEIKFDKLEE